MSLATARLFAILCPIDGGALPKWKPKVAGDHAALRFSLCRWGQTQLLGPKSTPGEPSDIGRIGMLEQSGNCCREYSNRSGSQNVTLALPSAYSVPCCDGNTDCLIRRHLGTNTP